MILKYALTNQKTVRYELTFGVVFSILYLDLYDLHRWDCLKQFYRHHLEVLVQRHLVMMHHFEGALAVVESMKVDCRFVMSPMSSHWSMPNF